MLLIRCSFLYSHLLKKRDLYPRTVNSMKWQLEELLRNPYRWGDRWPVTHTSTWCADISKSSFLCSWLPLFLSPEGHFVPTSKCFLVNMVSTLHICILSSFLPFFPDRYFMIATAFELAGCSSLPVVPLGDYIQKL